MRPRVTGRVDNFNEILLRSRRDTSARVRIRRAEVKLEISLSEIEATIRLNLRDKSVMGKDGAAR